MLRIFLLLFSIKAFCDPIVFDSILSPANCTHTIYHPKDKHVPHPFFSEKKIDKKSMQSPIKAIGSGTFLYHKETSELEYTIAYTNLSSPVVMIHLQLGYPHQDGPIIATLVGKPFEKSTHFSHSKKPMTSNVNMASDNLFGFIAGKIKITQIGDISGRNHPGKEEKMLVQGGCYITIHTHLNELGELRGQLTPVSTKQLR